jgi:uncharacterized protein (DUF924 family)
MNEHVRRGPTTAALSHVDRPIDAPATDASRKLRAEGVVAFWREAGRERWFAKDEAFDDAFRSRFAAEFEAAARGDLSAWNATAEGALALSILLDQYPRNSFRGTPRMYATDAAARAVAEAAIRAGHHLAVEPELAIFFLLPFGHSEDLAHQDRSVELATALGDETRKHAEHHRDIIRRFGRFPHRNAILGRETTAAEQAYLDAGGYAG